MREGRGTNHLFSASVYVIKCLQINLHSPIHHNGRLCNSLERQLPLTSTPTRVVRKLSERDDWKLIKNKIGNFSLLKIKCHTRVNFTNSCRKSINSPHFMQLEVYYHLHSSSLLVPILSHFSLCEYLLVSTIVFVKI